MVNSSKKNALWSMALFLEDQSSVPAGPKSGFCSPHLNRTSRQWWAGGWAMTLRPSKHQNSQSSAERRSVPSKGKRICTSGWWCFHVRLMSSCCFKSVFKNFLWLPWSEGGLCRFRMADLGADRGTPGGEESSPEHPCTLPWRPSYMTVSEGMPRTPAHEMNIRAGGSAPETD